MVPCSCTLSFFEEMIILCERTPCVHGKCYKIDRFTEICVCERNWSGIDCTQSLAGKISAWPTAACSARSAHVTLFSLIAAGSPSITRYYDPSISLTSAKRIRTTTTRTTTRIVKGTTSTTVKADLTEYLNWLNTKYGVNRTMLMSHQVTKSAALDPHSTNEVLSIQSLRPSIPALLDYTPCLSAPCLHNSTCVIQSEHAFRCICPTAFVGLYCEIGKCLTLISSSIHSHVTLIAPEILESNFFRKSSLKVDQQAR